ncbi:Carboxylic ester hydrolase [Aphelenchoides bicaudatus]|nr:Carboxylic ester hydrolase [Aphelenchoides bicaudatus]
MSLCLLFVFILLNLLGNAVTEQVSVQTKFGTLRGFLSEPFNGKEQAEIYLNIPYALPPVGKLRFEKPQPYNLNWPDGRDALNFGPGCLPMLNEHPVPVSEDCLSLNVFRPNKKKTDELLPVLVYVHGGGYAFGSSLIYGYQQLVENYVSHDLVVVTLNYRLGFFGFSSLGPNADYTSNLGLWDQTMAFRWIHENIKSFGGDPKRVTAQGLSAGAGSIGLLTLSPHSREFIGQTIEMSGSAHAMWAISPESIDYTHQFGKFIKCPVESGQLFKECLNKKTSDEMLKATTEFITPTHKFLQFTPIHDNDFFPKPLEELMLEAPKIPNLVGSTELEAHYFIVMNKDMPINSMAVPPEKQSSYKKEHLAEYIHNFTHWFGHIFENKKPFVQHEILNFYSRGEKTTKLSDFYLQRLNDMTSDFFFSIPAVRMSQARAAIGWPSYFYVNSHFNPDQFPKDTPCKASTHANEYPYMNGLYPIGEFKFDEKDNQFQQVLNKVIVDFAKNGKPSENWPQVTSKSTPHGHLTHKLEIVNEAPFKEALEFWEELNTHLPHDFVPGLPKQTQKKIEL